MARSEIALQFINVSDPKDASNKRTRKTVRSHVTRFQHKTRRQQDEPYMKRRKERGQGNVTTQVESSSPSTITLSPSTCATSPLGTCWPISLADGIPCQNIVGDGIVPEAWWPDINTALNHILFVKDRSSQIDPALDGGTLVEYYPLIFGGTADFLAGVLVASAFYVADNGLRLLELDFDKLKGMALQAVNESISSPTGWKSDYIIGAINHLAAFEALFGSPVAYKVHMEGLRHIVQLRGGIQSLGNESLEREILWIDSHGSRLTQMELHFPSNGCLTSHRHPMPSRLSSDGTSSPSGDERWLGSWIENIRNGDAGVVEQHGEPPNLNRNE